MLTWDASRAIDQLTAARERMAQGLSEAAREGARAVADTARANCPAKSGALRASISEMQDGVRAAAPYAAYVELGTYHTPPKPFLRPALAARAGEIRESARAAVEQAFL